MGYNLKTRKESLDEMMEEKTIGSFVASSRRRGGEGWDERDKISWKGASTKLKTGLVL